MAVDISKKEFEQEAANRFPDTKLKASPLVGDLASVRAGEVPVSTLPWVLPINAKKLSRDVANRLENQFDRSNPEDMKKYTQIIKESAENGDRAKELADYRQFEMTNDVMATPFALSAFQVINLSADELPLIVRPRTRNLQRFDVRSIGQDGGARKEQWRTTKEVEQILMEMVSTDRVEYPLTDIQQGDVGQVDAINTELKYDMEMKIDALAKANIDGAETAAGLRDELSIHPSIDVNNIPDKNYLDLNGTDPGVLTIDKVKQILLHIALFGSAGGADEPITIRSMVMSPQNLRDSWDYTDLVSGIAGTLPDTPKHTVPKPVRESIFNTGMFTSAWGYSWTWQPNAQLAKGRLYVFTNQPLGWMFTKTEYDRMIEWKDTPDHVERNMGEVMWRRAFKFFVPDQWKYRILIVDL